MHSKYQLQAHLWDRDNPHPSSEPLQSKKTRRVSIAKERWKWNAVVWMVLIEVMIVTTVCGQSSNSSEIQIMIEMGEGVDPVAGEQQQSRQSTIFDGVTAEKYITYLRLDANQSAGVRTTIGDLDSLSRPIDYTVMLWFKPQDAAFWGQRYSSIFEFENSLQCYFTSLGSVMCDSIKNCDKLMAMEVTKQVQINEWAHITVSGRMSSPNLFKGESYLTVETNTRGIVSEDSRDYLVLQQVKRPFSVCLGGCDSRFTFIGGLRDFVVLSKYTPKQDAFLLKNQLLSWDNALLGYFRFNEDTFLKDYFRMTDVQIVNQNASALSRDFQGRDYMPNDICPPNFETKLFHQFSTDNDVDGITIDSRWQPRANGWAYTTSMWVFIQEDSCSAFKPSEAAQSCFLVRLQDSFMVYQPQPNQVALYIFNDRIFNQFISRSVFVPHNQWINIQVTMNQYQGYQIQIYDILGRLISSGAEVRDLQSANVRSKQLRIFRGFRGMVKAFNLLTERVSLPLRIAQTPSSKSTCLVQVHFTDKMMKEDALKLGSFTLSNLCSNSRQGALKVRLSAAPYFVGQYNSDYPDFRQPLTSSNQLSTDTPLFDGIACNDGSMSSSMTSKSSLYQASSAIPVNQTLTSATVEFWFRTPTTLNETTFLFQLLTNSTNQEFLAIYYDSSYHAALICAPLGRDLIVAPFMIYKDYTTSPLISKYWLHIVCSFDNTSINSTLFQHDATVYNEWEYSVNRSLPVRVTNQSIEMYIGNNKVGGQGTPGLVVKELRLWSYKRSSQEIRDWRYQQIDPRVLGSNSGLFPLLTYIRFSEANFKEFNFASIVPQSGAKTNVQFRNIEVISTNGLTICPFGTFYDKERLECFSDPVQKLVLAIYPEVRTSNTSQRSLHWVFDSSDTQILDPILSTQLRYQWAFIDDPIADRYIREQSISSQARMVLPSSILRDENYYLVRINVTNYDSTYSKVREVRFVPINCQYYVINGQAPLALNNYTKQRSSEDISFTVDIVTLSPYCEETTFFNLVDLENLKFEISPQLAVKPKLRVQAISGSSVRVTIPKEEQYKFDISPQSPLAQNGFKIFLGVQLTNKVYKTNVQTDGLSFQNVVYHIRFLNEISGNLQQNANQEVVVPKLRVMNEDGIVLAGENALLDAGDTYVTNRPVMRQQDGLNYSWVCPTEIAQLCAGKTGSRLEITESQFKAVSGKYNLTYVISARITFTRKSGAIETFRTNTNVRWIQVSRPVFQFNLPYSKILVSAESQSFRLTFKDQNVVKNINLYQVNWSITPNISQFNLSNNNLTLTVQKNGFERLTSYVIVVEMQHLQVPQAKYSYTYSFTTQTPPYGGTLELKPFFTGAADYILLFDGWQGSQPPLAYRVASTSLDGLKLQDLSNGWVAFNQTSGSTNFTFRAGPQFYPIMVEITDYTEEIFSQIVRFPPPFKDPPAKNETKEPPAAKNETNTTTETPPAKNETTEPPPAKNETNSTTEQNGAQNSSQPEPITNDTSITATQFFVKKLARGDTDDQGTLRDQIFTMVSKEVADAIKGVREEEVSERISSSLKILAKVLSQPQMLSLEVAQGTLNILSMVKDYQIKTSTLFNSELLVGNFATCLGYLSQTPYADVENLFSYLRSYLCYPPLSLVISPLSIQTFSLSQLTTTQLTPSVRLSNLPLQLTENEDLSTCMTVITLPQIRSSPEGYTYQQQIRLDFLPRDPQGTQVEYTFTSPTDRIVRCVSRDIGNANGGPSFEWSEDFCETEISETKIVCRCNQIRSKWVTIKIEDRGALKSQGWIAKDLDYELALRISVAFSVAVVFAYFGLMGLAYYFDQRDKKTMKAQQLMTKVQSQVLESVEDLTGYSWFGRKAEISEFATLPHKSVLSLLIPRTYPLIDVFGYLNPRVTRLARLSPHLFQLSTYLLVCVITFLPTLRNSYASPGTLTDQDLTKILILGPLATLILLPTHFTSRTLTKLSAPLLSLSLLLTLTSLVLLYTKILPSEPILVFAVLASNLFGLSLGLTLAPLTKALVEYYITNSERVHRLRTEVESVRKVFEKPSAPSTSKESSFSPMSSSAKKRNKGGRKGTHVKFSDFLGEEDMMPQPSEEALEVQEGSDEQVHNQQQESIRDQSSSRIINKSLDNSVTPINP